MLLYGPDNSPIRRTMTLSTTIVRALCDGKYLLTHGASCLPTVLLEPYCRQCAAAGQSGAVAVTDSPDKWLFRCAHTRGHVLKGRPLEIEPLLQALNWSIRCTACGQDAAGNNSRTAQTFTVTCGCTTRELANPAQPVVS